MGSSSSRRVCTSATQSLSKRHVCVPGWRNQMSLVQRDLYCKSIVYGSPQLPWQNQFPRQKVQFSRNKIINFSIVQILLSHGTNTLSWHKHLVTAQTHSHCTNTVRKIISQALVQWMGGELHRVWAYEDGCSRSTWEWVNKTSFYQRIWIRGDSLCWCLEGMVWRCQCGLSWDVWAFLVSGEDVVSMMLSYFA